MRKVEDISQARLETPEQEEIRRLANQAMSYAHLGQSHGIAVVSLLNGGKAAGGVSQGLSRQERMLLIGELEALKAKLLSEE